MVTIAKFHWKWRQFNSKLIELLSRHRELLFPIPEETRGRHSKGSQFTHIKENSGLKNQQIKVTRRARVLVGWDRKGAKPLGNGSCISAFKRKGSELSPSDLLIIPFCCHLNLFVLFSRLVLESWLDFTGELEPPDPLTRLPQLKRHIKQLLIDMGKVQQIATLCSVWQPWQPTGKKVALFGLIIFMIHRTAKWIVKKLSDLW